MSRYRSISSAIVGLCPVIHLPSRHHASIRARINSVSPVAMDRIVEKHFAIPEYRKNAAGKVLRSDAKWLRTANC